MESMTITILVPFSSLYLLRMGLFPFAYNVASFSVHTYSLWERKIIVKLQQAQGANCLQNLTH